MRQPDEEPKPSNPGDLKSYFLKHKKSFKPQDPLLGEEVADRKELRKLRKRYAKWFFKLLVVQLIVMNVFFIIVIAFVVHDEWALRIYLGGTLLQVFAVVRLIVKNLFPDSPKPK